MKVMISLPDDMVERMRAVIPARQRSKVITSLLEKELERREQALYNQTLTVERDGALNREMAEWETTVGDGMDDHATW